MFHNQGHRVKVKVIFVNWLFWLLDTKHIDMIIKVKVISGVKVISSHVKVKVIPESNCKCLDFYPEAGGGPSTKCIVLIEFRKSQFQW